MGTGTLIDSSALIAAERDGGDLETLLAPFERERVAVAAITVAELLHGMLRASSELRRSRRERFVEEVLSSVPVLAFDLEVARLYTRLWVDLQAVGAPIGAHDLMIAATALCRGFRLLTHNARHFQRIEGLELIVA